MTYKTCGSCGTNLGMTLRETYSADRIVCQTCGKVIKDRLCEPSGAVIFSEVPKLQIGELRMWPAIEGQ